MNRELPQKIHFSTVALLAILRWPLDSWLQKKFESGLELQFWVLVSPARKTRKILINNLTSKSMIFETSPNLGKLYINTKNFLNRIWDRYLTNHDRLAEKRPISRGLHNYGSLEKVAIRRSMWVWFWSWAQAQSLVGVGFQKIWMTMEKTHMKACGSGSHTPYNACRTSS